MLNTLVPKPELSEMAMRVEKLESGNESDKDPFSQNATWTTTM